MADAAKVPAIYVMNQATRYKAFINHVKQQPQLTIELQYRNTFELLIAVILSAQCTDKRVNKATPDLFKKFPTAHDLSKATQEQVLSYIRRISYPNNKSKYLVDTAKMIVQDFGGEVPRDVTDLEKLPGVGRKTAHVVAAVAYNQLKMAVDVHVDRVSRRLGLVSERSKTPLAVEKELVKHLPEASLVKSNHFLVLHGRYICKASKPLCPTCALQSFCAYFHRQSRASQDSQTAGS